MTRNDLQDLEILRQAMPNLFPEGSQLILKPAEQKAEEAMVAVILIVDKRYPFIWIPGVVDDNVISDLLKKIARFNTQPDATT